MGTKNSVILAVESCGFTSWQILIERVEPVVFKIVGPLKEMRVLNFLTGKEIKTGLAGDPSTTVNKIMENEIVTFYPERPVDGCLQLYLEGRFKVVNLALSSILNSSDIIRKTWQEVGELIDIILVGEELEVNEEDLDYLLENIRIPNMSLCQEAIVKKKLWTKKPVGSIDVEYGGVLISRDS